MANYVDLKPRKELINPHFESYKLSLDPLPIYSQELEKSLDVSILTQDQLTLHHTKLFGAYNHLVQDPWVDRSVYFIDTDWAVQNIFIHETGKIHGGFRVFEIPEASSYRECTGRLNISLCFSNQTFAVLADGAGRLFLLDTGMRGHKRTQWNVLYKDKVLGENVYFTVVDSIQYTSTTSGESGSAVDVVECLLASVEVRQGENKYPVNRTILTWITLTKGVEERWVVTRTRRLEGSQPFSYASIERGGGAVTVASNRLFDLTADSLKDVISGAESMEWEVSQGKGSAHPMYTWSQGPEDVSVQLTLPAGVSKADIYVSVARDYIDIGVKNSLALLSGSLSKTVDVSASTWTLEGQRLELILTKEEKGMWETVVVGDNRGEMTFDEATVAAIHERLQHLTSDQWNPDPDLKNKPFNTQQLEACDAVDDEECIYLMRIDGETHRISHQATINYSLLFIARLDAEKAPSLCLRHDVDGLLWQPEVIPLTDGDSGRRFCPWQHVGTLDAFGYVQASKTQRSFSGCAPDLSLAVIADCSRHVYLYRQNVPTGTPLRNRRTGQNVSNIAKQYVVALEPHDSILGLCVSRDHIVIATASKVYALAVPQDA